MSYCRFSSDNFKSDVYAYESDEGFVVHVAANRIVGEVPRVDWDAPPAIIETQVMAQHAALDGIEHASLNLPHDGETFVEESLEGLEARLRALRLLGYHVPEGAFMIIAMERRLDEEAE